jgi:hypothetical protein
MNATKQRRRDKRLLCADLVELIWRDNKGRETRRIGNLDDICVNGVCLQLEMPLPVGTSIQMQCARGVFHGTVRYMLHREDSYVVGVEFDMGTRWSRKLFVPRHLLDPGTLAGLRPEPISCSNWIN